MPKKCLSRAKGARSVPDVGSRRRGREDSRTSSSSSLSTQSSAEAIKKLKKELHEQKMKQEASRQADNSPKSAPKQLESHMLPFFYPDDECDSEEESGGGGGGGGGGCEAEVRRQLVSHVTPCCRPVSVTVVDEDSTRAARPDAVQRRHLESHVTRYCYPVTGATDDDDDDDVSFRPYVVPPHLETHVASYCRPVDDEGTVVEEDERPKLPKLKRTNYVPRHLQSHLFGDDGVEEVEGRAGINCEMTRGHRNSRDSLFDDVDGKPALRRVGGRRPVADVWNLFEESKPKPRPMSITIVQRPMENTKENIFGSELTASLCSRRHAQKDTKRRIFGGDDKDKKRSRPLTPRLQTDEDTTEKLFGETYGIKEAEDKRARLQRRPLAPEDTQATLFGPPPPPPETQLPPHRLQSARSFVETHENLFGQQQPTPSGRRPVLRRENTFDNLFGLTQPRHFVSAGTSERYTPKNPKILQVSSSSVSRISASATISL